MLSFIGQYWLEFILTAISSGAVFVLKKVYKDFKKESQEQKSIKEGMVAILHDTLFKNCEQYIKKGEITISELDNLEGLYHSYHSLGGNGTGTELFERCKGLKIV